MNNYNEYKYKSLLFDIAYITVEDNASVEKIGLVAEDLLEAQDSIRIACLESNDNYIVIKAEYENWDEIKDICSTITYLLLQHGISSFTFDCKAEEFLDEYN